MLLSCFKKNGPVSPPVLSNESKLSEPLSPRESVSSDEPVLPSVEGRVSLRLLDELRNNEKGEVSFENIKDILDKIDFSEYVGSGGSYKPDAIRECVQCCTDNSDVFMSLFREGGITPSSKEIEDLRCIFLGRLARYLCSESEPDCSADYEFQCFLQEIMTQESLKQSIRERVFAGCLVVRPINAITVKTIKIVRSFFPEESFLPSHMWLNNFFKEGRFSLGREISKAIPGILEKVSYKYAVEFENVEEWKVKCLSLTFAVLSKGIKSLEIGRLLTIKESKISEEARNLIEYFSKDMRRHYTEECEAHAKRISEIIRANRSRVVGV